MSERSLEELMRDLRDDFKIDDYLELRRRVPGRDINLFLFHHQFPGDEPFKGLDFLFLLEDDFKKHDISADDYVDMLDGDLEAIDRLCLQTLAAISKRQKNAPHTPHAMANGEVIGDALVGHMLVIMAETLSIYQLPIIRSFQILLKVATGAFNSEHKKARELKDKKFMAAAMLAENPDLSDRQLAKKLGVNASTVNRWKGDDFDRKVNLFRNGISRPPPKTPDN